MLIVITHFNIEYLAATRSILELRLPEGGAFSVALLIPSSGAALPLAFGGGIPDCPATGIPARSIGARAPRLSEGTFDLA